jgi:short subunit dehydrogenase-like uncharacterized protein
VPQHSKIRNVIKEVKSTRQNTTSHVTVKQYVEGVEHSGRDTELQQVVGAPKKKKQKTGNDYVVQDKNKIDTMVSKVSPKTVQQQHINFKRGNAHCTSS